jgi:hypothetical protein
MSRYSTRLPVAPESWERSSFSQASGKEWADTFTRTLEISLDVLGTSTEDNSREASARDVWFMS